MSNGIDFLCDNKECLNFGTKMTLHGAWPIAKIEDILSSGFPMDDDFKSALTRMKGEGRTHACVPLPNNHDIATEGLRIQMYCPKCRIVWDEDFLDTSYTSVEGFKSAIENALSDPPRCRCGTDRLTIYTVGADGINCPSCGVKTERVTWFVKPTIVRREEKKENEDNGGDGVAG